MHKIDAHTTDLWRNETDAADVFSHFPITEDRSSWLNHRGVLYQPFWSQVKHLDPMYIEYERTYNVAHVMQFIQDNSALPIVAVPFYLVLIYVAYQYMRDRKPVQMKTMMHGWNLAMCVFSILGTSRTVPHLLHILFNKGLRHTACANPMFDWGNGATGLWVQLYVLSKLPQLLETFFIIFQKKPLTFLHCFHHSFALLYAWQSYVLETANGLAFVSFNLTEHSLLYTYYFAKGLNMVPRGFPFNALITLFQVVMMFCCSGLVATSAYYTVTGTGSSGTECSNRVEALLMSAVMFAAFFGLFAHMFVRRFVLRPKLTF